MPAASPLRSRSLVVDRFDFGRSTLKSEHLPKIRVLAIDLLAISRRYPKRLRVDIDSEGHTDPVGSREANLALGLDRARAVNDLLDRLLRRRLGHFLLNLAFSSQGADEPLVSNSTPAGRARNRRVEVRVKLHVLPEREPPPPTPTEEVRGTGRRGNRRGPVRFAGERWVPEPPGKRSPRPDGRPTPGPSIRDILRRARQAIRYYRRLRKTVSRIRRIIGLARRVKSLLGQAEKGLRDMTDELLRHAPAWMVVLGALVVAGPRGLSAFSLEFDGGFYIQGPGGFRIGLDRIADVLGSRFGNAVRSVEDKLTKLQEAAEALEEALREAEQAGDDGSASSSTDPGTGSPTRILAKYGFGPGEATFHSPIDARHGARTVEHARSVEVVAASQRPPWRLSEETVHDFLKRTFPGRWEERARFLDKKPWSRKVHRTYVGSTVPDHWNETAQIAVETKSYDLAHPRYGYAALVRDLSGRDPRSSAGGSRSFTKPVLQMSQRRFAMPQGTRHWLALDVRRQGAPPLKEITRNLRSDLERNQAFIFERLILVVDEGFLTLAW